MFIMFSVIHGQFRVGVLIDRGWKKKKKNFADEQN